MSILKNQMFSLLTSDLEIAALTRTVLIVLKMGPFGVWIAQGLDECLRAVGMGVRWKKKGYAWIEVTK